MTAHMVTSPDRQVLDYLADMRCAQAWGLRELARFLECSPGHLSDCEAGRKRPSCSLLRRWVEVLGGDPDEVQALWEKAVALQAVAKWRRS